MATMWPLLTNALLELLPELPGWNVVELYDGQPVGEENAPAYCTVGFVDVDFDAGTYTDALSTFGNQFTVESGEIHCSLVNDTGDDEIAAVRAQGFALIDALRTSLRTDPLVGVLPQGSTTSLTVTVVTAKNSQGVGQRLDFTLSYSCPVI